MTRHFIDYPLYPKNKAANAVNTNAKIGIPIIFPINALKFLRNRLTKGKKITVNMKRTAEYDSEGLLILYYLIVISSIARAIK